MVWRARFESPESCSELPSGAVAAWLEGPTGDASLLAAVKVGWEAGVQYNAFYYNGGTALVAVLVTVAMLLQPEFSSAQIRPRFPTAARLRAVLIKKKAEETQALAA